MQSEVIIKELEIDKDTGRPKYCGVIYGESAKLYEHLKLEYITCYDSYKSKVSRETNVSDTTTYVFTALNLDRHSPIKYITLIKSKKVTNSLIRAIKLENIIPGDKIMLKGIVETIDGKHTVITRFIKYDYLKSDD